MEFTDCDGASIKKNQNGIPIPGDAILLGSCKCDLIRERISELAKPTYRTFLSKVAKT